MTEWLSQLFFRNKAVHIYYPALIRLTKVSTEEAPNTSRGETAAKFVVSVIKGSDVVIFDHKTAGLTEQDLKYMSAVIEHLYDLPKYEHVLTQYQLLLDSIFKVWPQLDTQ